MRFKYTDLLVNCLMPPELLMLFNKARLIFLEFSLTINASLGLTNGSKLLLKILLVGWHVRASVLSLITNGNFAFLPIAYWDGKKPCTLFKELIAFIPHDTTRSGLHFVSSRILVCISKRTNLYYLSTRALLQ